MKLPFQLSHSIGLMQAVCVLVASLLIGSGLSALQLRYNFSAQQRTASELRQDVLTLAQGGATAAAWTLDRRLAAEVVASVMAIRGVRDAEIRDDRGNVLANATRGDQPQNWLVSWFARNFVSRTMTDGDRRLTVLSGGQNVPVGQLLVSMTPHHAAQRFLTLAMGTILSTLVASLIIGALLLWISSWLVTRPLRRAATAIAEVDPERSERMGIAVPPLHRDNELGHLLEHTNGMLARLSSQHDQLRFMATRDSLTGLPNRALIRERLEQAIAHAKRREHLVALLFLDLDRFKTVNDSLGHDAGDQLLVAVSRALSDVVRSDDSVGRLGGDEFVVVLAIEQVDEVVTTVRRIADALAGPFALGKHELRGDASIGIAIYPNDGGEAGTLMRQADLAMYKAKKAAAGKWYFFSHELSDSVQTRLQVESALSGAATRGEFEMFYQPKFDRRGRLAGAEALLRWHRDGVLVTAGDFVPLAEESDLIIDIGDWVVEAVCLQLKMWGADAVPVSLNVSPRQLTDDRLVDHVLGTLERHGVGPEMLELEITETVLMRDVERSIGLLRRLKAAGVLVSIDDFGTGYSSLSYLSRLPIDLLKIDRAFVSGSLRSRVLLTTIVAMAKALRIRTVAEGVETEEQRDSLVEQGCDLLQGYLLGRPVAAHEFASLYLPAGREAVPRAASRSA